MNTTIKDSSSDLFFKVMLALICTGLLIATLYPVYFVVIASISNPASVANGDVWLYPRNITFAGYQEILSDERIWRGLKNTLIYTIGGTLFSLLFTIPAGYALSRADFKPRKYLMIFFVFTMFFSGGLIPTYLTVQQFGLTNTIWVMLIPFSVNVFNLVITRVFFQTSIPKELLESAKLDGCSDFQFFIRIAIPLSKALLAVMMLYYAVGYWNEYMKALIYLNDSKLYPLQLVLRDILVMNQTFSSGSGGAMMSTGDVTAQQKGDLIKYGVIVVSSVPIIALFPFVQKYFEKGVMIGSLKD
ncbi:ABC transporter permease [Alkalihalobacillus alcalophilus ATCC 27647 = CGMCC 1.3604]|uniref:ABC transporter permease n=1 Tax=Alkalihalobacillus alcalophilus ATCC 27647 = CGMCC 1.3604 TaxID=1218173 RepID=J8Q5G1_ALKAL|nr:carbohydrate ABC transporter permease [Alkalihalobacillus alcalophilus]AFV25936.1 sugar transporter [Alkalihalobacillus alcalophilus ATCC 27647 = CGMCC 1.3604]KGA98636.1 sugar ABC transporter permease [Alkalihalobacillus alcalophilus ATCC 27647 = CGMCC 1.3604]MED1562761.1 carbohydrate ABC transporter permease [Alkalihalobacillus alcalophilus]THG89644.1 ABC transporter permease [Alkalihalobacillus alcalophilus ATCC 27647 = CGMCC 1.3604]